MVLISRRRQGLTAIRLTAFTFIGLGAAPLGILCGREGADWGVCFVLWGAATLLGAFVCERYAAQQADHLRRAVDNWARGRPFDLPDMGPQITAFRRLAITFKRATLVLSRQQRQLDVAVREQELAMQEIHHRVKNNLQIVASLLNLQASRIRVPEARAEFQSARDRVRALATLHRHLYAHGDIHTIDMREFLVELCEQLFSALGETPNHGQPGAPGRLYLKIEAPALRMSSDQAVPLALIVTEAVSNAVKYAFPGATTGHIAVALTLEAETLTLVVCDDGVGIPTGQIQTDAGVRDGIGIQLICGFARQLNATLLVDEVLGTKYVVTMPFRRTRFNSPELGETRLA